MRMSTSLPPRQNGASAQGGAVPAGETMDARELVSHLAKRARLIIACVAGSLLLGILYLLVVFVEDVIIIVF